MGSHIMINDGDGDDDSDDVQIIENVDRGVKNVVQINILTDDDDSSDDDCIDDDDDDDDCIDNDDDDDVSGDDFNDNLTDDDINQNENDGVKSADVDINNENVNVNDVNDNGGKRKKGDDAPNVDVEFPRKRFEGMVFPAYLEKSNNAGENNFIGKRTRSQFKPNSSSSRKNTRDGTFRVPILIDIEEESSHDDDDEKSESLEELCEDQNGVDRRIDIGENSSLLSHDDDDDDDEIDYKPKVHVKSHEDKSGVVKRKRGRPPKKSNNNKVDESECEVFKTKESVKKRLKTNDDEVQNVDELECEVFKTKRSVKKRLKTNDDEVQNVDELDCEVFRTKKSVKKRLKTNDDEVQSVLLKAISEKDGNKNEARLEKPVSSVEEAFLPLKFKYGEEESQPKISDPQECECSFECKCLFEELDFSLGVCEIGLQTSCENDQEDDEIVVPHGSAVMHKKLCLEGKHFWIQDDEIGIKCKFCSLVKLEIRDFMPDFNDNPFGRSKTDNRYYGQFPNDSTNNIVSERFQFPDFTYDSRGDLVPSDTTQGTVWDLIPGTKRTLYPHQRDGFEFLWKNIAGGIKIDELGDLTNSGTGGCIICHAPGTGKTRLAIVFLQSFMKKHPNSKPVILAPYSMLRTWEEEFARWNVDIPFFNLNEKDVSGKEDSQLLKACTQQSKTVKDENTVRMLKLATWKMGKCVLALSYGLFQRLAFKKRRHGIEKTGKDEMTKQILDEIKRVLLRYPDILVLDEGHTPRNEKSSIWKALSKVTTKRRVILSGTPFQNNFEELHSTISLVREEFGVPFLNEFNDDIDDGRRIEALKKQFEPFVHVHKGEILKETLPGLFHSLIVLRPSDLQQMFFAIMATIKSRFMKFDHLISVTSVHPSCFCKTKPDFNFSKEQEALLKKHRLDFDKGVKTQFLVELIKLCKGERILVFGQYLPPLNFIGDLLISLFNWTIGKELLYIYGKQDMKKRQSSIKLFNDPGSEARVLLASTKACCEGINLVGASRVVLLDVVWNPSVERQAISRAYRIGQKKDVFVYHLITAGTLEEEKYRRQTAKERFGELLFPCSSPSLEAEAINRKNNVESKAVLKDRVLEEMKQHDNTKDMFVKILPQPKADDLIQSFGSS